MKNALAFLVLALASLVPLARAQAVDPVMGCETASEVIQLSIPYSALGSEASKLAVGLNKLNARMAAGDIRGARQLGAELEQLAVGHRAAITGWRELHEHALLTDPVPAPPIDPEPPIEPDPPSTIPPPSGGFGASLTPEHAVWSIEQGSTLGDKKMHEWADNGGSITDVEIIAGPGSGVSNFKEGIVATMEATNIVVRAHPTIGTQWEERTKNRNERWSLATITALATPFKTEGHGRYANPAQWWESFDCLSEELYANPIQLAYRPGAEEGGPVKRVFIRDRIVNCHKPVDAFGTNSDRAGPLVALYGLGTECDHVLILSVLQDKWAQVGPIVTCVPEGAKDPASGLMLPPWWTSDTWTDDSIDITVDADILPPKAQELFRIAGVRSVSIRGTIKLRSSAMPRIMIDPVHPVLGGLLYRAKPAERVVVDLDVLGPDGVEIGIPIEVRGALAGTTLPILDLTPN